MEIKAALERQRTFFEEGVTKDVMYRRKALRTLRRVIERHEEDIFLALREDLGKSEFETYETELGMVYSEITYMEKHLSCLARPKGVLTSIANFPSVSRIYREPYGVVLIMSPWNYPFQLAMVPLIGAIAAGNCAVVKPSAYSPATSAVIKTILDEAFSDSFVYTVTGGREENQSLLSEKFDYIFFTGGKEVGKTVMAAASGNLTPVTLELGGKSPCIVDETADIALAARRIVWGKLLNAGQTCVAPDYVLVHKDVKESFLEAVVRNIEALYGDDPINSKDYVKIINEKHFKRLCSLLSDETPYYSGGVDKEACKIGPMVIADGSWDSKVMAEEIFGPIMPVIEYEDLRKVRKMINSRPKPLALYLFTKSKKHERYILKNVSFGGGCINDTIMHLANGRAPFGGVGESGMGAYHGKYSFETFSHRKHVLSKSTLIDVPLRYAPYGRWMKLVRKVLK